MRLNRAECLLLWKAHGDRGAIRPGWSLVQQETLGGTSGGSFVGGVVFCIIIVDHTGDVW